VPLSYAEVQAACPSAERWLWQGYLAPGEVTLLTSQWKSGKSTLLAVLLSKLRAGGDLAGLPVRAGRAVVVSEESPAQWYERTNAARTCRLATMSAGFAGRSWASRDRRTGRP
jgi:hypothetical protein